jgi:hypothetical protein
MFLASMLNILSFSLNKRRKFRIFMFMKRKKGILKKREKSPRDEIV